MNDEEIEDKKRECTCIYCKHKFKLGVGSVKLEYDEKGLPIMYIVCPECKEKLIISCDFRNYHQKNFNSRSDKDE